MDNYNASGQLEEGATEFGKFLPGSCRDGDVLTAEGQRVLLLFLALGISTSCEQEDLLSIVSKAAPDDVLFDPADGEEAGACHDEMDPTGECDTESAAPSGHQYGRAGKRKSSAAAEALESYRDMWKEDQRAKREPERKNREEQRATREILYSLITEKHYKGGPPGESISVRHGSSTVLEIHKVSMAVLEAEKALASAKECGVRDTTLEILEQEVVLASTQAQNMLNELKVSQPAQLP